MKIQKVSQTQDVGQAANLLIDAIFDGKSVKAVGSKIVVDDKNQMSKMSRKDKDQLVATFLYLIEKKRVETNPEYDPHTTLGQEDVPSFANWLQTRLPKVLSRPSSASPDELIALHTSARSTETRNLFNALRAALDVNPLDVNLETMAGRDTRKTDATVNHAINLLTGKFPAIFELTQDKYESNLRRLEHFARNPCYNESDVEELTYIWQHLAAHEEAIATGRLKTNGWPDSLYADPAAARQKAQELIAEAHVMVLGRTNEYEQRVLANAPDTGPNEATDTDDNPAWHQVAPAAPSAPARTPTPSIAETEESSVATEEMAASVEPDFEAEPGPAPDPRRIPMPDQNFILRAPPSKPAPYARPAGVAVEVQELPVEIRPKTLPVPAPRVLSQTDLGKGIQSIPLPTNISPYNELAEDTLDDIDTGPFGHAEPPLQEGDFVVEEDDMSVPAQDDIELPSEQPVEEESANLPVEEDELVVEEDDAELPSESPPAYAKANPGYKAPVSLYKMTRSTESASDVVKGLATKFPESPGLSQDEYNSGKKRLEYFEANPFQSPGDIDNTTNIWRRLMTSADDIASGKLKTEDWSDEYAKPDQAKKATLAMLNRFNEMILARTEEFEKRAADKLAEANAD